MCRPFGCFFSDSLVSLGDAEFVPASAPRDLPSGTLFSALLGQRSDRSVLISALAEMALL
jgi:hypothetical protein